MPRISSIEELKKLREESRKRKISDSVEKVVVNVSLSTCGIASGGLKVMEAMKDEVKKQGIYDVEFKQSGCMTYCHSEPTVEISLPGKAPVVFGKLDEESARLLVEKYIIDGEPTGIVIPVNYVRVIL